MAKREPEARYCDEHGVIVHRTHDVQLATKLATHFLGVDAEDMPPPVRTWLRINPAGGSEYAYCYGPAKPGDRGAFAAVEFPEYWPAIGALVDAAGQSRPDQDGDT